MTKKIRFSKKTALISTAIVLVVVAGIGGYMWYNRDNEVASPEPINPINYDPPTQDEKDQAQANKERIEQETTNQDSGSGAKSVTPVITNASQIGQQVTVNSYVAGIFEDGGKCTITFTKGTTKITKETDGFANVSTTDCTPLRLDRSEFPQGGDWQVVVSYKSSSAQGSSQSKILTLQ